MLKFQGKLKNKKPIPGLDNNRVRFNWGYHDGVNEAEVERKGGKNIRTFEQATTNHFDPIYEKGYRAGSLDFAHGQYNGNSEEAWIKSGLEDGYTDHREPNGPMRNFEEAA